MSTFLQLTVSGVALGCLLALVALSFMIVIKATGVFNLLQGAFVLVGAYLVYNAQVTWGLPFVVAIIVAVAACAVLGILLDRFAFRGMTRRGTGEIGVLAILLAAIGLLTVSQALVVSIWGPLTLSINDPWGLDTVRIGSVAITQRDIAVIVISLVLLAAFYLLIQRTRIGVAMRATASDPEAARAQGINPTVVSSVAWACAAVAGVLAGTMFATEVGGGVVPTLDQVAFAALPALILGGAGSLVGCVAGGVLLGLLQTYSAGYAPDAFGAGFATTVPWILMILLLVVKPTGLFGAREIRRA
ncbi:MAG: branched-chain amino acid transporter permease [Modestobacter sp.]|jgi:branched-chain amino acid transport system permease protein|nr:branched-chain amino acid transporter permease [Modestobacter sp.]